MRGRLPSMDNRPPTQVPWLTRPFDAAMTGWIVVFGAMLAELVGGAVTNRMPTIITVPVLTFPVTVAAGFAVVQWWQVRSSAAEPASWWHLGGVAAAVFAWLVWPTTPGLLDGATGSARAACGVLPTTATSQCLHHAAQALDSHNLAWWLTGALILAAALLTRRSRIAAWTAIPIAFAGCQLATHFLELLLLYYRAGG